MSGQISKLNNDYTEKLKDSFSDVNTDKICINNGSYECFTMLHKLLIETVKDYRRTAYGNVKYDIWEILTIVIICIITGITIVKYIMDFARKEEAIFKNFLELKNGIPKYDFFLELIHKIDPKELSQCRNKFLKFLEKYIPNIKYKEILYMGIPLKVYALDGKKILGSECIATNEKAPNVVSCFNVYTGETITEETVINKSNEIPSNMEIVKRLGNLENTVITLDALGCQKELADEVDGRNGLFLFHVKRNHPTLYDDIKFAFEYKYNEASNSFEKNRNRFECRFFYYSNDISYIPSLSEWPSVKAYGGIYKVTMQNGEITCEPHFYIMNFDSKELFIEISRKYWAIENELHYIEDVTFGEDACKVRKDNGPSVLNVIRKIGVTIFKRISHLTGKKFGTKRLVNFVRNSINDFSKLISGDFGKLS